MKRLLVLPTWLIARAIIPFLNKGHIWSGKKFTLRDWARGSTETNNLMSIMMWVGFICVTIALFLIF